MASLVEEPDAFTCANCMVHVEQHADGLHEEAEIEVSRDQGVILMEGVEPVGDQFH